MCVTVLAKHIQIPHFYSHFFCNSFWLKNLIISSLDMLLFSFLFSLSGSFYQKCCFLALQALESPSDVNVVISEFCLQSDITCFCITSSSLCNSMSDAYIEWISFLTRQVCIWDRGNIFFSFEPYTFLHLIMKRPSVNALNDAFR